MKNITISGYELSVTPKAEDVLSTYIKQLESSTIPKDIQEEIKLRLIEKIQQQEEPITESISKRITADLGDPDQLSISGKPNAAKPALKQMFYSLITKLQFNRLRRDMKQARLAGVAAGISNYFEIDPVSVRIVWAALTILPIFIGLEGSLLVGIGSYCIMWVAMPPMEHKSSGSQDTQHKESRINNKQGRRDLNVVQKGLFGSINIFRLVIKLITRLLLSTLPLLRISTGLLNLFLTGVLFIVSTTIIAVLLFAPDSKIVTGFDLNLILTEQAIILFGLSGLAVTLGLTVLSSLCSLSLLKNKLQFDNKLTLASGVTVLLGLAVISSSFALYYPQIANNIESNPGIVSPNATNTINLNDISKLQLTGDAQVIIKEGLNSNILITGYQDQLAGLDVTSPDNSDSDSVVVNYSESNRGFCMLCVNISPSITITTPDLTDIHMDQNSAATIRDQFTQKKLNIEMYERASLQLTGNFSGLSIIANNQSTIQYLDVNVDTLALATESKSSIMQNIYNYKGDSPQITARQANINLNGINMIYLDVKEELIGKLVDSAKLIYAGSPETIDITVQDEANLYSKFVFDYIDINSSRDGSLKSIDMQRVSRDNLTIKDLETLISEAQLDNTTLTRIGETDRYVLDQPRDLDYELIVSGEGEVITSYRLNPTYNQGI